ncbi:hypothetical protein GCM10023328_02190 [Modestobacter marinus]|uniref:Lipoprotein n=1 Tax=Modestobacter marinus TaxID=477641 RepID=A0A846LPH9_9ACTN|nr:hypothetical protein [Modestobacter marinus]NIH67355.1 hypothetical protein [Modestobacter marinus]GGL54187.1 lipoprotein [Modestobacter marinus]
MRTGAATVAVLTVLLVPACGGGGDAGGSAVTAGPPAGTTTEEPRRSGPELVEAAADALEESGAVRVRGTATGDGEETPVDVFLRGDDLTGTFGLAGRTVEIVRADGEIYARAPAGFYEDQGVPWFVAGQLDDVWVTVPEGQAEELDAVSVAAFAEELRARAGEAREDARAGELAGRPVLVVTGADGTSVRVAAEGEPYPLRIDSAEGDFRLDRFGSDRTVEAPGSALDVGGLVPGG